MLDTSTFNKKLKIIFALLGASLLGFGSTVFFLSIFKGNTISVAEYSYWTDTKEIFAAGVNKKSIRKFGIYLRENSPKGYIVQSGSMEPTIKVGSIVFSAPKKTYKEGDIVTFASKPGSKSLVTHRIEKKELSGSTELVYRTQGDANEEADPEPVKQEQMVGKVVLSIPYLGYAANYAKQPYGFILLVIVPATIVIYEELKSLFGGVFGGLKLLWLKRREKKKSNFNTIAVTNVSGFEGEVTPENKKIPGSFWNKELVAKSSVLIPVLGSFLFFTGIVNAYLNDKEDSNGNVLQAGIWEGAIPGTPTPTLGVTPIPTSIPIPTNVVINELLYDTATSQNITGQGGSGRGEFLEIYNPTLNPINVTGWIISDDNSSETLSGIVPALGFMIITGATESEFRAVWSIPNDGSVAFFQADGGLIGNGFANDGDRATLSSPGPVVVDSVSWGNDTTFLNPAPPDVGSGHSLERNPDGLDTNTDDDFVDRNPPTPGS